MESEESEDTDVSILDLPDEIMEYILSHLSPYRDFKACMLVCKPWFLLVKAVSKQVHCSFQKAIHDNNVIWNHLDAETGPTITERFSHSACYYDKNMYVFGGCTSTSTTFNDLWRFDLISRQWIRPLSMGTYPSPKACASMVTYKDCLILFGGWTHPTPYLLHQASRFFNQLHIYHPLTNKWSQIVSQVTPPPTAGHSASVVGDKMVIFGGSHGQSYGPPASCNDIWVLNLLDMTWLRQETLIPRPQHRYGQSQIVADENHLLILGGCGGPNMLFKDVWLLRMDTIPWTWKEMHVLNSEFGAPHLWCHPACKVGNKVVVLSKAQKAKTSPIRLISPIQSKFLTKIWVPPQETDLSDSPPIGSLPTDPKGDIDICVNGKRGTFKRRYDAKASPTGEISPVTQETNHNVPCDIVAAKYFHNSLTSSNVPEDLPSTSSSDRPISNLPLPNRPTHSLSLNLKTVDVSFAADRLKKSSTTGTNIEKISPPSVSSIQSPTDSPNYGTFIRNTQHPSIRPNALKNRQRQLEGLRRMAERIKNYTEAQQAGSSSRQPERCPAFTLPVRETKNPMQLYVLDISKAISHGCVAWLPASSDSSKNTTEETICYTLIEGRGELIMFGGIQMDVSNMRRGSTSSSQVVTNKVHFISAQQTLF